MEKFDPAAHGYDEPERASGHYLRLEAKGEKARLRIVSAPIKFVEEKAYPDRKTGEEKLRQTIYRAWLVIHKELINGQKVKTVKGFKAGPQIYAQIYDLVCNPDWGDPTQYDLEITRTEEQGRYYTVQPLPKPIGPISPEEEALVQSAGLDLKELFISSEEPEPHPADGETDPFADEQ